MNRDAARFGLLLTLMLAANAALAQPARISEWVEDAPASDNTKIALGYPVPIPVDTPLPFDGFRSYAGLHARHQDLALTTPWVHPHEIGTTRNGRTIWAYQLGDADRLTPGGVPEHAMLSNGGIHAREWQSPEVATGIIELLALAEDDDHLISYLRDHANIVVIPVLNVDGFLQTQRYPNRNWMGTDPNDPEYSPRDGRMRRKNMLGPDEDLLTQDDHLLGVDLNRNNPPYWATNPARSSGNPESIVHHGEGPHSEPETQALVNAAVTLAPVGKLSMYTDMHSFSQVHFWSRNDNARLARLTETLLSRFSDHHLAFPAGKLYAFTSKDFVTRNSGIGLSEEYFTQELQVPSWTLEIEPSNGGHPNLPGQGADYGGLGRNGHDGFILPDSEVERVRTELAQTFMVAYYRQAGPPSITALNVTDRETGAVVLEATWTPLDDTSRSLQLWRGQPLQLEREYRLWVAWDKPMRSRTDGRVEVLQGQPDFTLNFNQALVLDDGTLDVAWSEPDWQDLPGHPGGGYLRYRDDAAVLDFRILDNQSNRRLLTAELPAALSIDTWDMTGYRGDADPATVVRWENGGWSGYEDHDGASHTDSGGADSTIRLQVTPEVLDEPFLVEPGMSGAWYDPARGGEGFLLEILDETSAVMYWFTYDDEGRQDWYLAQGEILANRIVFPELLQVTGGEFGPGFDPEQVVRTAVGSAVFTWSSCDAGVMEWTLDDGERDARQGRMDLARLTSLMSLWCGPNQPGAPEIPQGQFSGSWFDPDHSGEGYELEILWNQAAVVYWFSFDAEGNRRWFFGQGRIEGSRLLFDDMLTTRGARFGEAFDPDQVVREHWGVLELDLDCESGQAEFVPVETGFPAGELSLRRLTVLDGLACEP